MQMQTNKSVLERMFQTATGRWDLVASKYMGLKEAIDRFPRQVPCPINGGSNSSTKFRFQRGFEQTGWGYHEDFGPIDVLELISRIENISKGEAAKKIIQILDGQPVSVNESFERIREMKNNVSKDDAKKRASKIRQALQGAILAKNSDIAIRYFEGRLEEKLKYALPECILFHPGLALTEWDNLKKKSVFYGNHPCLLIKMIDSQGVGVTVHRIYLHVNQRTGAVTKLALKSRVTNVDDKVDPKKVFAPPRDMSKAHALLEGVNPKHANIMAYAEGIETAIAIRESFGFAVKMCFSNTVLQNQEAGLEEYHLIFADKDKSFAGQKSAFKLQTQIKREGKDAYVFLPDMPIEGKGVDFLDQFVLAGEHSLYRTIKNPVLEQDAEREHEQYISKLEEVAA